MIVQSPESDMPEPYRSYVRQRNVAIAEVLGDVVGDEDIQLCPRAILPEERIFSEDALVYGAVVASLKDGYKDILYGRLFKCLGAVGVATRDPGEAEQYAVAQFQAGNRIRVKDAVESDGNGQHTIDTLDELHQVFSVVTNGNGLNTVVMPHLDTITHRISVGYINLGEHGAYQYLGNERTLSHGGSDVYGGTEIGLFSTRAEGKQVDVGSALDIPSDLAELGMRAIKLYKGIAIKLGRVSVDVIQGTTDNGKVVKAVIDVTPRVGGVTPAEVLATREVHRAPDSTCFATSELIYDPDATPKTGYNFIDTDSLVINARIDDVI